MTTVRAGRVASILAVGVVALVCTVCGCGGSPLAAAKPDSQTTVHSYQAQGFSIAFGPQWQESQQNSSGTSSTSSSGTSWSATIGPSSQSSSPTPSPQSSPAQTAWQLNLTTPSPSGEQSSEVLLSVGVTPESHSQDPATFQAKYEQMLKAFGASPQAITLDGVPAVYWKGMTGDGIALASGRRAYILFANYGSAGSSPERPAALAVMQSFKLLP